MEGLINLLNNLQGIIYKGYNNFKKSPKERLTIEYIDTRLELLEKDWASFTDANSKLHERFALSDIGQKVVDIYDCTEDTYITYKSLMKSTLNKIKVVKESGQPNRNLASSNASSSASAKLPKITIPTFSGNYSEWTTFHDLFTSMVHKNEALDNVQKLHYLKSHLTGEADQLIRHTPISDANYGQCWSLLEKRYSNKKYLSNCILQRLFSQKRIYTESAAALKELIGTTCDCLNALKNLNIDVSSWDVIIIHIVSFKLDSETRKQWELSICNNDSTNDLPTFEQFKVFIDNRFRALECIEPKRILVHQTNINNNKSSNLHKPRAMIATNSLMRCEFCSESHKLCFCKKFAKGSCEERREFVAKNNICFNCLGSNHTVYNCKKASTCKLCQKRHHSLLHQTETERRVQDNLKPSKSSYDTNTSPTPMVSCLSTGKMWKPRQVLLATALIRAEARTGQHQMIRALLDQGSQACFITEATVQFLNLKRTPVQGRVSGLGHNSSTMVKYMVHLTIQSRLDLKFKLKLNAFVLNNITSYLPERSISSESFDWLGFQDNYLADPEFKTPNKIDVLLGADVYSRIIQEGILKSTTGTMIAQNTSFGWILSGGLNPVNDISNHIITMHVVTKEDILRKFWEIEEQMTTKKILTPEEQRCEEFYSATTKRDCTGRYIVKLPFREEGPSCKFGNSRNIAEARFKVLEKRLSKNAYLKKRYTDVINEYIQLGHMREVDQKDKLKDIAVYLPHHAVVRDDKSTTKVRVVFNASEKNSAGVSLNDTLMIGPTLQPDLRHTVLKWRVHPIGLVADIIKMYRQIKIADEDAMFQRILWRDSPAEELKDYELVTVTFGTACAPYQAVRTLHQVAYDEGYNFPLATDKVLSCFYMDDLMTGCDTVESGLEIYKQIKGLLGKGGFMLQKWNSNNKEILERIRSTEEYEIMGQLDQSKLTDRPLKEREEIAIKQDSTIKILGLTWNRNEDTFQYTVNLPTLSSAPATKRSIISDIARLFDPLGWLAPSIVVAKVFIQKLWLAGVGWDDNLNSDLVKEWCTYRNELLLLTNIRVPRWLGTNLHDCVELHGFCDASKTAYSAVVYVRTINTDNNINVALLVAKTRVAPVKQISIPRLELCGAVLLSKLLSESAEALNISKDKIRAWTDSTVVLAWLNCHPSRWKTFVGNRTSEILTTMKSSQWFHVSTKNNPADCASRGMLPSVFIKNTTWFLGPSFLKERDIFYKRPKELYTDVELSVQGYTTTVVSEPSIFERFSSLQKLIRVIAYCRRFLKSRTNRKKYLLKEEIQEALECCIKTTQRQVFTMEYLELKKNGHLQSKTSKLKSLSPYLDNKGIIRVRGRIEKAQLDEATKHPIILHHTNHLTHLLVADAHFKTLHGGLQLMSNYLRTAYWILGSRNLIKKHIRKCVTCVKYRATTKAQLMGSLPEVRCSPTRPFLHSGVDYAGPINIRTTKGRGYRSYKGYICLFVCMCTKALHLEAVTDMSTQAFLAAFRRFVSRRGHCAKLWSDNGTTFVGAARELEKLKSIQSALAERLESRGTEWHFIPPHSPNFGGLWEAGVKSTKFHLKRVIGEATLTYEEISTLLCQVEACLNSRPISVINSTDPGETLPLTPGHFLIGEPLVNVPDNSYENSNVSSLTRWRFVQRMMQSFWKRWSYEYLSYLMNRYKWTQRIPEPKIGDIVLVKEDDLPPSRWLLGRVVEKHPGDDNITRVVTLRTRKSIIKRPTSKLCILPVAEQ